MLLLCPALTFAQPAEVPSDPTKHGSIATAQIDWNDQQIEWHDYPDGLIKMKSDNKAAILIVYADWCGVCKRYSKMFLDPEVVKQAKNVVLIRINQDTSPYVKDFAYDGNYVPRTFILDKRGKVLDSPFKNGKYSFFLPPGRSEYFAKLLSYMGSNKSGEWSR
jgi:thiol-disulfide isomerase/thioredoxin